MRVVCAWCKKHIRGEEEFEGEFVSHGVCPVCAAKISSAGDEFGEKTVPNESAKTETDCD